LPTWLTGKEAMAHLRVSKSAFYKLVRDGQITQYTIPGLADPRYKQDELDALFTPVPKGEAEEKEDI
jgi:hypothetical protein